MKLELFLRYMHQWASKKVVMCNQKTRDILVRDLSINELSKINILVNKDIPDDFISLFDDLDVANLYKGDQT
jgi:predicted regulator of amino acid metabolism with ACT domain